MAGRWRAPVLATPGEPLQVGGCLLSFEAPHLGRLPHVFVEVVTATGRRSRQLLEPRCTVGVGGVRVRVVGLEEGRVRVTWEAREEPPTGRRPWWRRRR